MALLNGLNGACNSIIRGMGQLQGNNYAFELSLKLGYLDYLLSDFNLAGSNPQWEEIKSNGKIKKMRVIYSQRTKDDVIKTGQEALDATLCDDTDTFQEKEDLVEIDQRIATRVLRFSNEQLNEICENSKSFIDKYVMQEMRAGRQKLNKILLAETDSYSGKILGHDGTDYAAGANKSIKLVSVASNGDRIPLMGPWAQIPLDYTNMELMGTPAIIGQGIAYEFFKLAKWSCCNATIPFDDAVALSDTAFFLDQTANEVLGANELVVIAPGSQFLMTYNKNATIGINTETHKHIVLQDPVYPALKWDMDWRWNECTETWDTFLSFYYKLYNTFQDDSFQSGDRLDGMTGIFKYRATAS